MKRMKGWGFVAAAAAAWAAGCGSSDSARERTGSAGSEIQAGAADSTHSFVVGVVQVTPSTVEFCTGALLAPNLVATARHCVSQISSPQIDCATSTFGALDSTSTLYVTTDAVIPQDSSLFSMSVKVAANGIKVPADPHVCGNDIALLILSQSIPLPAYVVPAISPPLTDPSRSTKITAIGYGIDTPTDDAGASAGTRRIKENVSLTCIPGDISFVDCFSDPLASQYMTTQEFISGDETTCEGDSGSGVYDQTQFDAGKWVSYGVLSRGSVSSDGQNCVQPIYTLFDKYATLLSQTAVEAAGMGGYAVPAWATSSSTGGADAGG
ncbi:MAG: trypsin-like serine protease, partial [Polyangiaceae bacterium]